MSSGEVPYLSGASNHCQENLQRWSLRLPRVILYTWRGLFQSGIGRPSMKLSHFRTYNVSCRIGPCIRNTWIIFLVLLIIAKKICRDEVSDCQELYCTHEEADTRMILHAIHADKTSRNFINACLLAVTARNLF
jgi:hypothetical protein